MDLDVRARRYAALGDPHRLAMVDALRRGDLTMREAAAAAAIPTNLAAHHVAILEGAGLVERRASEGDRRRRYVVLRHDMLPGLAPAGAPAPPGSVLFVCTRNSARSQFAARLWGLRTGGVAASAGAAPGRRVHPLAVRAAAAAGVDLSGAVPRGYRDLEAPPDLVVSVCDRAHEAGVPFDAPRIHWSVPDPVPAGRLAAFAAAFAEIARRVDRLAAVPVAA